MYFCIKYHKEKESTYLYFIEKTDTYVLYNWNTGVALIFYFLLQLIDI